MAPDKVKEKIWCVFEFSKLLDADDIKDILQAMPIYQFRYMQSISVLVDTGEKIGQGLKVSKLSKNTLTLIFQTIENIHPHQSLHNEVPKVTEEDSR